MNARIIYEQNIKSIVLDELARKLPVFIAETMEVPGGSLARVRPEQVSLEFSQADLRDVGAYIRIMVFARNNDPRISTEDDRAKSILDKVIALLANYGEKCSVDMRLYLLEVGSAEYLLNS